MVYSASQRMIVLGIHDGHTAGAVLLKDGELVAAICEERLNNIKNFYGPPILSVRTVYEIAGISPAETDAIAIGCFVRVGPPYADQNWLAKVQVALAPYLHTHAFARWYVRLLHRFRQTGEMQGLFREMGMRKAPVVFVDHHQSHAAGAYYQRPWKDEAVVLTLDGSGDGLSATVSVGKGNRITRIAETSFYDSISNNLYSEITGYLGMKRWEHEYKVMGLAPYGKDDGLVDTLRRVIRIHPEKPLEFQNTYGAYLYTVTTKLSRILTGRRFDNIAWATQEYFEELVVSWVKNSIAHTGISNIVCSGGSFLNVKANKRIRELPQVRKVFFYPACDDGGTPAGAALELYNRLCRSKKHSPRLLPLRDLYLGQQFDSQKIQSDISKTRWKKHAKKITTGMANNIAELLSEGKIIARFSGRDEWGPRALGNRSILADPRNLSIIHRLNFAVKHRDFWMPFAASILHDKAKEYFKDYRFAPYMIEAFDTKKTAEGFAAGLHPVDRTCRVQSVNGWNPGYRDIIREFHRLTGVPAILNTSFNLHGYPIVGTPDVALATFEQSGIDALVLEDWLIEK